MPSLANSSRPSITRAKEVEQQHERWLVAQQNWVELRRKVKSYEVLEKRHIAAENLLQDRKDQKQSDELVGRKIATKRLTERD